MNIEITAEERMELLIILQKEITSWTKELEEKGEKWMTIEGYKEVVEFHEKQIESLKALQNKLRKF